MRLNPFLILLLIEESEMEEDRVVFGSDFCKISWQMVIIARAMEPNILALDLLVKVLFVHKHEHN
jgi:hypothetical protein